MPRDYAVEAQRAAVLREELARTRARLAQALAERDELLLRLDRLRGLLVPRCALAHDAALRLLLDVKAPNRRGASGSLRAHQ